MILELRKNVAIYYAENIEDLTDEAYNRMRLLIVPVTHAFMKQEGMGLLYRLGGFWGQRAYLGHKTREYSSKLKIDKEKCVGCGECERLCPMKNITIVEHKAVSDNRCTMCYRCINKCPKQAITLLGNRVVEQCGIEKYL